MEGVEIISHSPDIFLHRSTRTEEQHLWKEMQGCSHAQSWYTGLKPHFQTASALQREQLHPSFAASTEISLVCTKSQTHQEIPQDSTSQHKPKLCQGVNYFFENNIDEYSQILFNVLVQISSVNSVLIWQQTRLLSPLIPVLWVLINILTY